MREMKDSGIEWIGEIPADWEVSTIKREYVFQTGWTPDTTHEEYFVGENIWINISDMKSKVVYDSEKHISDEAVRLASMNISPKGSLLYAFKLSVGAVSFCGIDMYTNEAIATFLPGKNNLRFLYYTAPIFIIKNANENIYGAKLLNQKLIRNAKIVIPPLEVQKRIVDYLDRKCGQIDAIIARQQEVIEKLKAYKLSVITEAVTKGLNPDVPMKDSGVEWIGEIPEYWQLSHIGNLVEMGSGGTPNRKKPEYWENGNIPWMSSGEINDEYIYSTAEHITELGLQNSNAKILPVNTVMLGLIGQGKTKGLTAILKTEVCCNQNLAYLITDEKYLHYRYLFYCFKAMYFYIRGLVGESQAGIYSYFLKKLHIPLPDIEQQIRISDYLDTKREAIKSSINKRERIIEKFTGYKKALIYEVVTGKKEV